MVSGRFSDPGSAHTCELHSRQPLVPSCFVSQIRSTFVNGNPSVQRNETSVESALRFTCTSLRKAALVFQVQLQLGSPAMAAFVTTPARLPNSASRSYSVCSRNATVRVPRRSRIMPSMCADPERDTAAAEEPVLPKEPYPGFYADMKRTGLTDEEAQAQALKAQKQKSPVKSTKVGGNKNLLKPDGTPYAPWMSPIADYDATVIKKRTDATGRLAADPQSAELSGLGVSWKMLGDELELSWATGSEEGNRGFVVYRRPGKSPDWKKVSDYRDKPAELASRGLEGGRYSFLVPDPQPGTWVYRVSDVDQNNNVSDLSQVLIEIESAEDTKAQKIALAVLLSVLALALFAGISLDPLSSP